MKSSSNELVISVLIITTLTLVVFMWWGWSLRYMYESNNNNEINNNNNESDTNSRNNKLKTVLLTIYTSFSLIIIGLIYVFYVANNDTISIGEKATATTLLAQIKGSLLSERWIASNAAKILKVSERVSERARRTKLETRERVYRN